MQTRTSNLTQAIQSWWTDQHRHPVNDDFFAVFRGYTLTPCGQRCGWPNGRTRDQLVREVAGRIKASDVDAARALESPEGRLATTVVSALLPAPYGDEFTFLVDIVDSAGTRSVRTRNWSIAGAIVAACFVMLGIARSGPVAL